jgi:predicted Rossmann fold flavoprotein
MSSSDAVNVIVVGAGAAGLMAAVAAAQGGAQVRLLDSQTKIGAKILVSGGGRCNVTNEFVDASRFHTEAATANISVANGDASSASLKRANSSGGRPFVTRVLRAFSVEDTHRFFEAQGVTLKLEETGKFFPVSNSSRTVLDALLNAVRDSGAELVTGCPVLGLRAVEHSNERAKSSRQEGGYSSQPTSEPNDEHSPSEAAAAWLVNTAHGAMRARAVVLCSGGLALPKSGSNGAGYSFATRLGHTLVPTTPALTPLLANCPAHAALSGVTLPVRLSLCNGKADNQSGDKNRGQILARYDGSFLFTHIGYSGPVALNISRHVARERASKPDATVFLRLLPDIEDGGEKRFWHEFVRDNARKSLSNALSEMLPRRVAEMVEAQCNATQTTVGRLNSAQQSEARRLLFDCALPIHAVADYVKAEATAGGIALAEIEPATMMSRLRPGLFFAGEICDVDGWLGGYNFQWAWSSGVVAGRAAARLSLKLRL